MASRLKLKLTQVGRAREFAQKAHEGQFRKYTDEPYFNHCHAVATKVFERIRGTVSRHDQNKMVSAAYLHDTLEDTDTTVIDLEAAFGDGVARLVCELTDAFTPEASPRLSRADRKELECFRYAHVSDEAKLIKLCDVIDNTRNIVEYDPKFAIVYLREKADLLEAMGYGE